MKNQRSLRIVIKLGTSSIVDERTYEPILSILSLIVETAVKLRKDGHKVVIVSSGAIGVGLRRMNAKSRPKHLSKLQALAAIGQCGLISLWDSLFTHLQQPVAQILLTRQDIANRTRYRNAQNTFNALLDMGVIPIVNENDTLAVSEIKFGDNDTLSAITAGMVHADQLYLMTDVDCLYDKNPRTNPDAQPIEIVEDIGNLVADVSTAGSSLGTGGMSTKLVAARLATSAGVTTIITRSSNPGNIHKIVQYIEATRPPPASSLPTSPATQIDDPISQPTKLLRLDGASNIPLHTRFLPSPNPIRDRSFWILHGLKPHGTVYIDTGAHAALIRKAGLLPSGVVDVEGSFAQQEAVRICVVEPRRSAGALTPDPSKPWDGTPIEVGRALVNYASTEIARIKGMQSRQIETLLGYADSAYVAEREDVCFFNRESRPVTPAKDRETRPVTPIREIMDRYGIGGYESGASSGL